LQRGEGKKNSWGSVAFKSVKKGEKKTADLFAPGVWEGEGKKESEPEECPWKS